MISQSSPVPADLPSPSSDIYLAERGGPLVRSGRSTRMGGPADDRLTFLSQGEAARRGGTG